MIIYAATFLSVALFTLAAADYLFKRHDARKCGRILMAALKRNQ